MSGYGIRVMTAPEVKATEEGTGQSTATTVEMVGEPGGAPAAPDPNQTDRAVTSLVPSLLYPRWTPPVSIVFEQPQGLPPPSDPLPPLLGSHRLIATDSSGTVHVLQSINGKFVGRTENVGVSYHNNRHETRTASGFSQGVPVSLRPEIEWVHRPSSIAVDADDNIHMLWVETRNLVGKID